jgi:hypothetical protein
VPRTHLSASQGGNSLNGSFLTCSRRIGPLACAAGEVPQDGGDFIHLRKQKHLAEECLGGGLADMVGDLHGGRDMALRIPPG